jgi:hypothetical protein
MSDRDTPEHEPLDRDPVDRAYLQAEAMLDDGRARAARRARVLAAVAAAPAAGGPSAQRRSYFGRGGWLIAASIVGVSMMVALQIRSPFQAPQPASPPPAPSKPVPASPPTAAPPPARTAQADARNAGVAQRAPLSLVAPPAPSTAKPAPMVPPQQMLAPPAPPPPIAEAPPLPIPPVEHRIEEPRPPAARSAAPAAAAAIGNGQISELVVTTGKRKALREDEAEQLRAAAAAGRADDVAALLAKGAPVDLPDEAGDTALMKSVRADHPAAAILLRHHGASLDRRNLAGESARSLAATAGDPELDRALGLAP